MVNYIIRNQELRFYVWLNLYINRIESWEEFSGYSESDLVPSLQSALVAQVQSTVDLKLDVGKLQNVSLVNVKRYFTWWIKEAPIAMSGLKKFFKKKSPSSKNTLSTEDLSDAASIASGYSISKDKDLPKLHKAVLSGDLSKLKQLVKKGDINQLDRENR